MSEDAPELTAELVVDGVAPSQPVISPDGCWVAYVVAPAGRKTERRMCAIWLAAVDGSSPPAKLTAITLTASPIDQAGRFLPELVTSARLNGHTWHDIAQALATSPDEARLRFDPDSPVADGVLCQWISGSGRLLTCGVSV
jgi:hypothetical protein